MLRHKGSYITINNHKLYYKYKHTLPGKPVLVFLHDSLGCTELWRDFPEKLARATQCNMLVYDRLGYGKSGNMPTHERANDYMDAEADTLYALLTELNVDNAILFGHSDGGSIALITAAKYPKRIKALICEAAHIFVEDITVNGIKAAAKAYVTTDLPQRLQKYHGNNTDTLFKAWTLTWTKPTFKLWNIEHILPAITCPLLFIQGEADEYGSLQQVQKTITQISGPTQKYIIPGIGHTPHKDAPDKVTSRVIEFIETLL